MVSKGVRRKRRHQRRAENWHALLAEEYPEADSVWSCDASIDVSSQWRSTNTARIAVVPTSWDGEPIGVASVVELSSTVRSTPQMELISVLASHVIALSTGASRPVVLNDNKGAPQLLRHLLGLDVRRGSSRGFAASSELRALTAIVGELPVPVSTFWLPRNSMPALKRADILARKPWSPTVPEDSWAAMTFHELLERAESLHLR